MESRTKVYIGIDIGVSTGIAILDEYGELLCSETVKDDAAGFRTLLLDLQQEYNVLGFAVEYPVGIPGPYSHIIRDVENKIAQTVPNSLVVSVSPGVWKNSIAYGHFKGQCATRHEQDAAEIALYWMLVNSEKANT